MKAKGTNRNKAVFPSWAVYLAAFHPRIWRVFGALLMHKAEGWRLKEGVLPSEVHPTGFGQMKPC